MQARIDLDAAKRMLDFIDDSPSPFHACAAGAARLGAAGFVQLDEREAWPAGPGRRFIVRGGSLVAWALADHSAGAAFRLVGAHTDSPNLRVRPRPDTGRAGCRQLAVEVYGSALVNSWLDRDLGVSGRLTLRPGGPARGPQQVLVRVDEPVLRIPQLAIHLQREVLTEGLKLNPQEHLAPIWGLGDVAEGGFLSWVAVRAGLDPAEVAGWDLMAHDLTPAALAGVDRELVSAARLDNLCSCWAGLEALIAAAQALTSRAPIPVLALFDHEEVGSTSERGADGSLLIRVLERISLSCGGDREALARALAGSACLSADMAHATHPNYLERHEPGHLVALNGGPVLKFNSSLRYATDAASGALFMAACEQAGVPLQRYAHRGDLPCGSTIGPIAAARLGVPTADVGAPQLAMHSARELGGSADPAMYAAALSAFLAPAWPAG